VVQDSSAPSTAEVVAVTGGHPGNPWREQRLLSLYQDSGEEPLAVDEPELQPLTNAA
jgi:hypothetical protein